MFVPFRSLFPLCAFRFRPYTPSMLLDYHMHTRLTDGTGVPADYADAAIKRGLDEIGFSDHAPLARDSGTGVSPVALPRSPIPSSSVPSGTGVPPVALPGSSVPAVSVSRPSVRSPGPLSSDWHMTLSDLDTYVGWVREAQHHFPKLQIKLGLEIDFFPGRETWIRELAAMHPWDFLLGSIHYIGDWPVDRAADDWKDVDVDARWREYFDLWKQAARSRLFDSLAHPDLPKKFNIRPTTDFTAVFEDALQAVAASNVAIEVSSAGLRKPCREIYPSEQFLRIARKTNVPISFGSDAHIPDDVGADFDQAIALARKCGYDRQCRFTRRLRESVPL